MVRLVRDEPLTKENTVPDHSPIAYTYDADVHCPGCASEAGMDVDGAKDSEGNEPGAIAPWDEVDERYGLTCRTCHGEIVEAKPWLVIENTPGYLPESDEPALFETFEAALECAREQALDAADRYEPDTGDWNDELAKEYVSEAVNPPESDEHGNRDRNGYARLDICSSEPHDLGRVIEVSLAD